MRDLFDQSISDQRSTIDRRDEQSARPPASLKLKFLYRLFVSHSNAHTDDKPAWQISSETFESALALYQRDQEAFDRGQGAA